MLTNGQHVGSPDAAETESEDEVRAAEEATHARVKFLSKQLMQSQTTSLRIENFSLAAMRSVLIVLLIVDSGCIALGVLISIFSFFSANSRIDGFHLEDVNYDVRSSVILAEVVSRTAACVIVMIALFYYAISVLIFYYRKRRVLANGRDSAMPRAIMSDAHDYITQAAYELVYGLGAGKITEDSLQKSLRTSRSYMHVSEHCLIMFFLLLIAMNPTLSIYGIVIAWRDVSSVTTRQVSQFAIVYLARSQVQGATFVASVVLTSMLTAGIPLFLYGMVHFQDKVLMQNSHLLLDEQFLEPQPRLIPELVRMNGNSNLELGHMVMDTRCVTRIRDLLARFRCAMASRIRFFRKRYLRDFEWAFVLPLLFYFGLMVGCAISLGFHPSYVPLTAIVTAIRVCLANTSSVIFSSNSSTLETRSNSTIFASYSTYIVPGIGVCSPAQPDPTPFYIVLVIGTLSTFEFYFALVIYRKGKKMVENLGTFPYDLTRSNQLGFAYYRIITGFMLIFGIVCSIVVAWIEPLTTYMVSDLVLAEIQPPPTNSTSVHTNHYYTAEFTITPFAQIGLAPLVYGLGAVYLILAAYVLQLVLGFVPKEVLRSEGAMMLTTERDVSFLGEILRRSRRYLDRARSSQQRGLLTKSMSVVRLPNRASSQPVGVKNGEVTQFSSNPMSAEVQASSSHRNLAEVYHQSVPSLLLLEAGKSETIRAISIQSSGVDTFSVQPSSQQPPHGGAPIDGETALVAEAVVLRDEDGPKSILELQLHSRVFVLETAVLLYHFMSLSYDLSDLETEEERNRQVENPSYSLCLYAEEESTDTHAFVFESADRIIVSFRGSVTVKNYKTDWDSAKVESEHGASVEPLLDDEVNLAYSRRLAARPALVHGGFIKAYDSVKSRIFDKVEALLAADPPDKRRCLLVTGHSLGGGLAVVCAFDLGVRLHLPPHRIGLMTWGCPKIGTFSFVKRVHRIVPCAHRIATANDLVTQLPFEDPVTDWTLRGWHHVGAEILLLANGNLIMQPSPIELYIIHKLKSSVSAHFRLSYAIALAAWAIRVNPEWRADWWVGVINNFNVYADFSSLPPKIRQALQLNLRRPGVTYFVKDLLVRDQAVDTSVLLRDADLSLDDPRRIELIQRLLEARDDEEAFVAALRTYMTQKEAVHVLADAKEADLINQAEAKEDLIAEADAKEAAGDLLALAEGQVASKRLRNKRSQQDRLDDEEADEEFQSAIGD